MDSCGQLFGPCWVSSARARCSKLKYSAGRLISIYPGDILNKCRWWWPQMKLKASCNWPMSHAKRMTRDNRKNPEYHVVAAIRKLMQTDTNCPAGKSWPNHVKKEQYMGSEKTYCTCIGVFNCLSTLMEANRIAELWRRARISCLRLLLNRMNLFFLSTAAISCLTLSSLRACWQDSPLLSQKEWNYSVRNYLQVLSGQLNIWTGTFYAF